MRDSIDRQTAIDALCRYSQPRDNGDGTVTIRILTCDEIKEVLEALPSVQSEITHCKDCKNSEHWYRDRRRCFLWSEDGVSVFDNGFCNYAQRKE